LAASGERSGRPAAKRPTSWRDGDILPRIYNLRRNSMRTTTTMAAAAACLLGLTLSSGCAIDKGAARAEQFQSDWADTADIASVHTKHDNLLPFAGSAEGTLVVQDGTPATRVIELAEELASYLAEHKNVSGRIEADAITFSVISDKARTGEVAALWQTLASDDRVAGGDIDLTGHKKDGHWAVEIDAVHASGAIAVFKDLAADDDLFRPFASTVTSLKVATAYEALPSLTVETDRDGAVPTEAIAAYEQVAAQYSIVSASVLTGGADIVVSADDGGGANAFRVSRLAGELAGSVAAFDKLTCRIEADGITFSVHSDEARTGEIVSLWQTLASDDRILQGIIELEHYNGRAFVAVVNADPDATLDLFRDLVADNEPYRPLSWTGISLSVRTESEAEWSMNVGTDDDGRFPVEAIAAYEAVAAQYPVVSANLRNDKVLIVVAKDADLQQAESLARAAAPNLGDAVDIRTERGA
jgi:hypothetical protein